MWHEKDVNSALLYFEFFIQMVLFLLLNIIYLWLGKGWIIHIY